MNESIAFLCGVVFGAVISGALLTLFGQWLFATGQVFAAELTPDEETLVAKERLYEMTERAIALTPWPSRVVRQKRIVGAMKERAS